MAFTPVAASNSMSLAFPSLFVPEKEKNEAYHKQYVQAIANRTLVGNYYDRCALMNECVNFYLGLQSGDEFAFLQKAEDGEVLPAKWADYNKIAVKIDLLIGELAKRGYKINVRAYNKDAQSRRLNEKNRLLTEMQFQPIASGLEQEFGLPIQQAGGFVPQTTQELDIYMDKTYKEKSEIVMRGLLSWLKKHCKWDYQRLSAFRDLLIMGACFFRSEVLEGIPTLVRVDPRNIVFDPNVTDDYLSDASYWGEVQYMTLSEVTKRYKITQKELEEAYKDYQNYLVNPTSYAKFQTDFGFITTSANNRLFDNKGGQIRIMVLKAYWQDVKVLSNKYSEDKYGATHIKRVDESEGGENVKKTPVQFWREGHLIGGKFLKEWGPVKNQDRSVDNLSTTTPPYLGLIPNFLNGAIVSKVHRLKPLQNLKNISWYNLQFEMARSGGKVFFYDVSQLPKGWDIHTAMKYAKIAGIAFIDSSTEGAGTYNQFKSVDLGVSSAFSNYLEVLSYVDREMDSISGVNEARQGLIQGSSQAVGVTNSAILQSSLSTEMYYNLFSGLFTLAANKQAGLAKLAWASKERFAPIIGDVGINFLEEDIELELNDYNVFIEETAPALADQQLFYQLVMTGIQSRSISLAAGIKLLMEKDLDEAVQNLEMEIARQEARQEESQAALMQQEQELTQAQENARQAEQQMKLQAQQMKGQSDLQKVIAQGRLDTRQGLLKFKQDLALKRVDAAIQIQKEKMKPKPKPASKK